MNVKLPKFMSPRQTRDTAPTFGENVAVKMSQRTLLLILGAAVAGTLAWNNLKGEASKNHDLIMELTAVRANDAIERKADHDLLVRVASGVELLQRKAERDERRADRASVGTGTNH
jgi:hypothetical protein